MKEKIKEDIKAAMRAKDELRLSVLRMLVSAIHNKEIEKRAKGGEAELTEDEVVVMIRSEVKKRRDAIREFEKGKRQDLAEKENQELHMLEDYLPPELSEKEVEKIVHAVIAEIGEVSTNDFGRIMGDVMKRIKGHASGDRVSAAVRKFLEK